MPAIPMNIAILSVLGNKDDQNASACADTGPVSQCGGLLWMRHSGWRRAPAACAPGLSVRHGPYAQGGPFAIAVPAGFSIRHCAGDQGCSVHGRRSPGPWGGGGRDVVWTGFQERESCCEQRTYRPGSCHGGAVPHLSRLSTGPAHATWPGLWFRPLRGAWPVSVLQGLRAGVRAQGPRAGTTGHGLRLRGGCGHQGCEAEAVRANCPWRSGRDAEMR
jgi:hypothetical protein